jgi:hypothetical protein
MFQAAVRRQTEVRHQSSAVQAADQETIQPPAVRRQVRARQAAVIRAVHLQVAQVAVIAVVAAEEAGQAAVAVAVVVPVAVAAADNGLKRSFS